MIEPFTIKTFFPTKDPSGLRVAFVRGLPIKAFYIPRSDVPIFERHYKRYSSLEGMYMLFNASNLNNTNKKNDVYIGKTTNILNRMKTHESKKDKEDWWNVEIAFTITDNTDPLDEGTTSYLEYLMCKKALYSSLFRLRGNEQRPKEQSIAESDEDYNKLLFHNIDILSKSLGFDVFLNINKDNISTANKNIFVINRNGSDARATYTTKGLMILKGSRISLKAPLKHFNKDHYKDWPIKNGVFTRNKLCNTPSEGSHIIIKGPTDGWLEWHKRDNKKETLDYCYR